MDVLTATVAKYMNSLFCFALLFIIGIHSIFDVRAGIALNDTFVKLVSWYDNEWGKFTQWHRHSMPFFMLPHVINCLLSVMEVMQLKEKFQQAEAEENEDVVRKAQANIY